jgi:ribosomal protein S14
LEVSVTGTVSAPTPVLTATDRCDRCGAQAYVRVVLPGGGDLMFCRHHARAHGDKLGEVAVEIHDESDQLDLSPTRG